MALSIKMIKVLVVFILFLQVSFSFGLEGENKNHIKNVLDFSFRCQGLFLAVEDLEETKDDKEFAQMTYQHAQEMLHVSSILHFLLYPNTSDKEKIKVFTSEVVPYIEFYDENFKKVKEVESFVLRSEYLFDEINECVSLNKIFYEVMPPKSK